MLTRRDVLRLAPAALLARGARAAGGPGFERIDTHVHIHREAPALYASLKNSKWCGLDIVVCPTEKDEPFDPRRDSTRRSGASGPAAAGCPGPPPYARGFESPDFADRTIARLRKSFADGPSV